MKCKAVLREIEELEEGALLSPATQAHLHACAECRSFRAERQALKALLSTLDAVEAPPDFDWRLRARLAEAKQEHAHARSRLHLFAPGARALAVAASVTLLLVAVVVYRQVNVRHENSSQASKVSAVNVKEGAQSSTPKVEPQAAEPLTVNSEGALASKRNEPAVRVRSTRGMKANGLRQEGYRETASQTQRIFSNDSASRGAESVAVAGLQNDLSDGGPVISVRVPAAKASQLRLEDGQGIRRTLSPVNFGGQELMGRPEKARLVPASEKGIW
jgi:hypothetical protein